nr:unnamed protein product [Digitaria exilis]
MMEPPAAQRHWITAAAAATQENRIAFVPSSPPPAPTDNARFSLNFLPRPTTIDPDHWDWVASDWGCEISYWRVVDCHGGLVLVLLGGHFDGIPNLIVCGDPLTRRVDFAGRVDGSIYLGMSIGYIKVLDSSSLKVSKVDLPIRADMSKAPCISSFTIIHGVSTDSASQPSTWMIHVRGEQLEFFRLVRGCGEWVLEHTIPDLSEAMCRLPDGLPEKTLKLMLVDVISCGTGTAVLSATACNEMRWFVSIAMDTKKTYRSTWPLFLRAYPLRKSKHSYIMRRSH